MQRSGLVILLYSLILCGCITGVSDVSGQTQKTDASGIKKEEGTEKKAKKESGKLKNDLKKLKKALSFKNFFHHDDSARLARQYIHEQHKLTKGKKGYPYNVDHKSLGLKVEAYAPSAKFNLKYEVLGWYPYWEKDFYKHLNYSLLTTVAYFSYEVNPATGNPLTTHDWETTPLLDSAKAHGNRVLLTVSNFGKSNNKQLLENDKAIKTLIDQLKLLLEKRAANGICVDFEGIDSAQKDKYSSFVTLLSQELKKADNDYLIYLTVPAVDWEKYLDYDVLIPVVDQFVIMGYGYYGATSKVAGPVAPLSSGKLWEPYNLATSVNYYMANKIPPAKLILALPYYGVIWETVDGDKGAKVKSFLGSRTYDYIRARVSAPVQYDTTSKSAWSSYVTDENNTGFRQVWFENDSTLGIKLDFIKGMKLNGMGIWALGYDKGYQDLWKVIANNLTNKVVSGAGGVTEEIADILGENGHTPDGDTGSTSTGATSMTGLGKKLSAIEGLLQKVTDYKTLILWIMFLVVLFGGAGFIIAMFQPDTRMFFFGNTAYTIYYAAFVLLFLIVALRWTGVINDLSIALILGFISGAVGIYFISKVIEEMKRNMP